jgi:hypothetical protein
MTTPKHRKHQWHPIREQRVPALSPRHVKPDTRLGADDPDIRELMSAFVPPAHIREMGRR